jgi:hypothetical protein
MTKRAYHPSEIVRWKLASCAGKERYADGGAASKTLRHMKRRGDKASSYRCSHCGGWHIGRT